MDLNFECDGYDIDDVLYYKFIIYDMKVGRGR